MTRVSWDSLTQRLYETGVDRGMLYPATGIGVAWNGLVSINESSSGGEAQPVFYDEKKILNLTGAEDFDATITAFSSPEEFGVSDGAIALQTGLYVTQQPRRSFGISYRTLLGNAAVATELGYKIHLIYGCKAAPAERTSSTVDETVTPQTLSWKISALPANVSGHKPSSHFVVDSRLASSGHVASVEDILYGTSSANPRLPTVSELITLFSS